jgi:predicted outer membrane repeat protein
LWIGPDTHDDRLSFAEIGVSVAGITPEAWSTCATDEPISFTVTVEVADRHVGEQFDAWAEVDGGARVAVGTVTASDEATVELTLDSEIGGVSCAGVCVVPVRLGLERTGVTDTADVELVILAGTRPALGSTLAVDATGTVTDLATAPTQGSPPSSLSDDGWLAVGFTVVDPQLAYGFDGGDVEVAVCPPGTSPEMAVLATGPCTRVPADREEAFDTSGAAAFVVDSTELGKSGCDAALAGTTLELHALVLEYTCGGSYAFPVTDGVPLVVSADCDGDLASWPEDCDDLDADRSSSATETWYDGVDSDCSGGSDDDQDGDGVDALDHGGTDCDDVDAERFPGAVEICDGKDDDCDGVEATGATLADAGGAVTFPTIQDALDLAADGDTVTVCDGRYDGPFTVRRDITLTCGTPTEGACTLDGGAGTSVLTIGEPGAALDVDVSNFTITGASGVEAGGGIDAREAASLDLESVVITGNAAVHGGGLAAGGVTTLQAVEIRDNTATSGGGGILLVDGAALEFLDDSVVTLNDAPTGGGLYAEGVVTVTGAGVFSANMADAGGAVGLRGVTAGTVWTISEVTLAENDADVGGAVDAEGDGTTLALTNVALTSNVATLEGGALAVRSTPTGAPFVLTVDACTLTGNAGDLGGALAADDTSVTITAGTWSGNEADNWGGAAYLIGGSTFDATGTTFDANTAELGGAVYTDGSAVDLTDGTLNDNVAEDDGGGLYLLGGATVFLHGTIQVDGNLAPDANGDPTEQGAYVQDEQLVACTGAQVLDPVENTQASVLFGADCFEVTALGFDATQCDGC